MKTRIHSVARHSDLTLCRKRLHELKRDQPDFKHELVMTDWQSECLSKGKWRSWNDWDKVNCPNCIAANTPGSSLYKARSMVSAKELPIDKRFASVIADAMRSTDQERRKGHENYDLASAMTALMEVLNIHLPKSRCSSCGGSGKVAHHHSVYCYRETFDGDELVCGSSTTECTSCRGLGFISEDLFKKG